MAGPVGTSEVAVHPHEPMTTPPRPELPETAVSFAPGTRVEVWCPSLDRWVEGFEAVDVDSIGWSVRRMSDRQLIPDRFDIDRVRVLGEH